MWFRKSPVNIIWRARVVMTEERAARYVDRARGVKLRRTRCAMLV